MSIEIRNVVCGYLKDITILNDVSVLVEKSKVTSVIGPNGAGKSTLLKTIYGYIKPKKGSIIFDGEDITGCDPHKLPQRGLVYIPQQFCVFPYLTVRENLEMGTWIFRKDRERINKSIIEIYARYPILKAREKIRAGKLSGGEQRILGFGRALMVRPKTILLDEPTAGLAPKKAEEIYQKIGELLREGLTVLLVDQNIRKALALSDNVYVIKRGSIAESGSREKFEKQSNSLVRDWLI